MPNMNIVVFCGHLCRDPELRTTPGGSQICTFTIAETESWVKDGKKQERTTFLDCVLWGKGGEIVNKYCRKGSPLLVNGKLKQDEWQDKTTGAKRTKIGLLVEEFQLLRGSDDGAKPEQGRPPQTGKPPVSVAEQSVPTQEPDFVSDIPF